MNPNLSRLHPYPFEKLNQAKMGITPDTSLKHIALSIGEPKHQPPPFVLDTLNEQLLKVSQYPTTKGLAELREAISHWTTTRFELNANTLSPDHHILPVNGTREALFAFTQTVINPQEKPLVISPNPFYQIYEGASLLAGAELRLLNCLEDNNYLPDFSNVSEQEWQRCQLLFLCSPGNPTGQLFNNQQYQQLIELADRYNFIIASDECYSELYWDENQPPVGLLQACADIGRDDYQRCIVFHSLSKRSNLPGLRSGFVAGDKTLIEKFLLYRTYHGCAMPTPTQLASISAWQDEQHVVNNRKLYRKKYRDVSDILNGTWNINQPPASFYLWAKTPINDVEFTMQLFAKHHMTVLPGSFLSRTIKGINPGENHVRIALVAPVEECTEAAHRLKTFIQSL
ncbi:succinyldiaminopimelate transaminase [Candidatus Endobugula sertula]|uniref:Succinyldiaminopimelate transaminase n=1 Tax=Candidatus Endobugula sertula TaxID=62101 RepID=A0A1D2QQS4_9GAMM|nr:succinyldiaminopimelate transaminase [Candidatus Endobugula sertula]